MCLFLCIKKAPFVVNLGAFFYGNDDGFIRLSVFLCRVFVNLYLMRLG